MSRIRVFFILVFFGVLISESIGQGQCNTPNPSPGLYCDPTVPEGAPILCELSCLNGYTARMPEPDSALLEWQPKRLCDTGQQGDANNLSWFAFVAGSETIRFRIIPSNCTVEENNLTGVQAGIYSKCYTWESVYCEGDCQDSDFEIGGPGFTPGETYYFFIDGCNGSVCDYEVELLEGEQPYPIPDIDSIIVNSTGPDICRGETVTLELTGLTQDSINYYYSISPATVDYPSGVHPESRLPVSEWTFSEVGTFTICAQGDNGCDLTPQYCQEVTVDSIPNEVFTPVDLCMEDLVPYTGPMSEDPNSDGTVGWLGRRFFSPGLNLDTIVLANGCWYTQEIVVSLINGGSRENVVLYKCPEDFPFLYGSTLIDQPVENFHIDLDNAAISGCDSLVNLSVRTISIDGELIINDCDSGQGILSFVPTLFPLEGEATFSIAWRNPNGNAVTPYNGDDTSILLDQSGIYEAEVTVTYDTIICSYVFQSSNIDINDLRPATPGPVDWNTNICHSDQKNVYRIIKSEDDTLLWTYPPDVSSVVASGDSLVVNWGNSIGGDICVTVTNSCGQSDPYCQLIERRIPPSSNVIGPSIVCLGDTIFFSFDGNPGNTFTWELSDIEVLGSPDLFGAGPFEAVIEGESGIREMRYTVDDGVCRSSEAIFELDVIPILDTPMVVCSVSDNSVLFSWEDVPFAEDYQITVLTGNTGVVAGNSYFVDGLQKEEEVTISIQSLGPLSCGYSEEIQVTCIAGCEPVSFLLSADEDLFCEGDNTVELILSGNLEDGIIEYQGQGVNSEGIFSTNGLSPGTYPAIGQLSIDNCVYRDTIVMEVVAYPFFEVQIANAYCVEDQLGSLTIFPPPLTDDNQYYVNDVLLTNETTELAAGNYQIYVDNGRGCPISDEFTISMATEPNIGLQKMYKLQEGLEASIPLLVEGFDTSQISYVEWYDANGLTLCSGPYDQCGILSLTPTEDFVLCADITYGEECAITQCTEIDVERTVNIFFPTIFTPNNDGANDVFTIKTNYTDITISKFMMYDRWGEMVYGLQNVSMENNLIGWDGNYRGKEALPGVYIFVIQYVEDGVTYTTSGDVTLIR